MNPGGASSFGVRLLTAGITSFTLLIWVTLSHALPPLIVRPGTVISPWPILLTGVLAITSLVILVPVLFRGSLTERLVGTLLGIFPFLVFSLIVVWGAGIYRTSGL